MTPKKAHTLNVNALFTQMKENVSSKTVLLLQLQLPAVGCCCFSETMQQCGAVVQLVMAHLCLRPDFCGFSVELSLVLHRSSLLLHATKEMAGVAVFGQRWRWRHFDGTSRSNFHR